MKKCSRCNIEKAKGDFAKQSRTKCGLQSWCRDCMKEYNEGRKDKAKKWQREHYIKNRDEFLRKAKEYRENNRDEILRKHKEYAIANKDRLDEYHAQYRKVNRKIICKRQVEYQKRRYRADPSFCMVERLRSIMQNALKRQGFSKNQRTIESLGCTAEYFKNHIERQFLKGMSWENRGDWHIDHIIPISSASTEEEIYALSHFTNLRPMWAEENKKKADKITTLL